MKTFKLFAMVGLGALLGCEGAIDPGVITPIGSGSGSGSGSGAGGGTASPGAGQSGAGGGMDNPFLSPCVTQPTIANAPMRRLSHDEYRNSIIDAFNLPAVTTVVASSTVDFVNDPVSLGYRNNANFLDVKPLLAQQYQDAAEKIAPVVAANFAKLVTCNPATAGNQACGDQFVTQIGKRLYRRDLNTDEKALAMKAFTTGLTGYDFATGIEFATNAMLQSPKFLYRLELDLGAPGNKRTLNPFELATRLSYLVWHSGPDDALLTAAGNGTLMTKADVAREAQRLLTDAKAQRQFHFFEEWLDLDEASMLDRNTTTFPNLDPNLLNLQKTETQNLVADVVLKGDGKFSTLMTAPYTFVNAALAKHYGMTGVTGTAFQKVALGPKRVGLWMQGGVISVHDKQTRTSIVRRGLKIRTDLLCQTVDAPPNNVNLNLGPIDQGLSQADRLAQHRTNASCAGCHVRMDPIGQVFETIDAVGRERTVDEGGKAIDPAGEITAANDATGKYVDAPSMVAKLGTSKIASDCFVTQLYRFSMGRSDEQADQCSTYTLKQRFQENGGDIRDLLVAITQTDDFYSRNVLPPVTP